MSTEQVIYSAQRRQQILSLLERNAHVAVADLANRFGVSRATIRRDLGDLRALGMLRRTYGGAVLLDGLAPETPMSARVAVHREEASWPIDEAELAAPMSARAAVHREEKERIGRLAARLVTSGQTIFLDGGSTVECMVPYLADLRHLTVVTYGLNIINRLVCCDNITVIVQGGTLDRRSLTISGALGSESMSNFGIRFDKAFIAASGVSAEEGVTNSGFEEIPMKRRAIDAAREVILLADASKVGFIAAGVIAPITRIHRLVTGREASADQIERMRHQGVIVDLV